MPGIFFVGTDTDVGKTFITAKVARLLHTPGQRVGVYKPACSGAVTDSGGNWIWQDIEALAGAIDGEQLKDRICPQRFNAAKAPPVAASLEGGQVDWQQMLEGLAWWQSESDMVLVEGVGGFLCPLTESETIADFAVEIKLPLVIVAHLGLGTINHSLLTLEAARARGLDVAGIILNQAHPNDGDPANRSNQKEIEDRGKVPVLGVVEYEESDASVALRNEEAIGRIDWNGLMRAMN